MDGIFASDLASQPLPQNVIATTGDTSIIADNNSANVSPGGGLITASFETLNNGLSTTTDAAQSGAKAIYAFGDITQNLLTSAGNAGRAINQVGVAAANTAQNAELNARGLAASNVAAGVTTTRNSAFVNSVKQHPKEVIAVIAIVALGAFLLMHAGKSAT